MPVIQTGTAGINGICRAPVQCLPCSSQRDGNILVTVEFATKAVTEYIVFLKDDRHIHQAG